MVEATTILIAIIFIIIVAIIIAGFFFFNRDVAATAQITDFGLPIQNISNNLFMTIENIEINTSPPGVAPVFDIFPIMSLKERSAGQPLEPTEGWILKRPEGATGTTVTFFNPSNSGYMIYGVTGMSSGETGCSEGTAASLQPPYIKMDRPSIPQPNPSCNNPSSQLAWFDMEQTVVNKTTVTTFRSLNPGPINGVDQFLIAALEEGTASSFNPSVWAVTIGIPDASAKNHQWVVGNVS